MPGKPHLRTYFEEDKVQSKQVPGEVVLSFSQGQLVEEAHTIVPAHTQRAGRTAFNHKSGAYVHQYNQARTCYGVGMKRILVARGRHVLHVRMSSIV